jgi:hypothetical protein
MRKKTSRLQNKSQGSADDAPVQSEPLESSVVGSPIRDRWEIVEYGDFNLADFRWHAAALIKYLIRAREKSNADFLGAPDAYRRWGLADIAKDRESQIELLKKSVASARLVWADMQAMGGSGGVRFDDPLQELKSMIAAFAYEAAIEEAIAAIRRKKRVSWNGLADWQNLSAIRDGLDTLPTKGGAAIRPALEFEKAPVARSDRVTLFPKGHRPAAVIDNEFIKRLTAAQHEVLLALIIAGAEGLSKNRLVQQSHHGDALGILRRLARSNRLWQNVIDMPGVTGGRYRIH